MPKENIDNKTSKSNKPSAKKKRQITTRRKSSTDDLSDMERIFCNKYVELHNITQAAIAAGYSKKSAGASGSRLLSRAKVRSEIDRLQKEVEKHSIATAQEVMEFFTRCMKGEEKDQFGLDISAADKIKAGIELAKRTVDLENRMQGKADAVLQIKLDWQK